MNLPFLFTEESVVLPSWFILFFVILFVLAVLLVAVIIFQYFKIKQAEEIADENQKTFKSEKDEMILKLSSSEDRNLFLERQFDSQKKLYSFFRENGELSEGNLVNELFRICSALYPQLQHVAMIVCENGKGSFTARNSGKAELINGDIPKPVKREKRISIKFMNDTHGKTESMLLDYLYGFDDDISVFADEIVLNSLTNKIIFVYVFPEDFEPECCLDFLASLNFVTSFFTLKKKYLINQDAFEKQLIFPMIKILELYDPFILGHSENVARYASLVSEGLGLNSRDKIILYWSSQVHDIGKIMVPSTILRKTGRYTAQEYEILKMHAQWGGEILSASQELSDIACFVRHHHERWDGKGYPDGLSGNEIPLFSRIIAIADTYDNFINNRSFREGMTATQACDEMKIMSGTVFDPVLLEVFLDRIL